MIPCNLLASIELRIYQKMAIEAIGNFIENYTPSDGMGMICLPTGRGKTLISAGYLATYIENPKNKVIWLAPEVELLAQANDALVQVLGNDNLLRRIGTGSNHPEIKKLKQDLDGQVFLSTLQAWHGSANQQRYEQFKRNLLIVVDEVHWGVNATMIRNLT